MGHREREKYIKQVLTYLSCTFPSSFINYIIVKGLPGLVLGGHSQSSQGEQLLRVLLEVTGSMWCHWHAFHLYNKTASPRFSRGQPTMVGSCDFQMILLNPLPTVDPLQPWHGKVKQLTQGHRVEQVQNSHTSTPKAGPTCSRNSSCTWLIHLPLNP